MPLRRSSLSTPSLATALAVHAAEEAGAPCLIIKGLVSDAHGLRPARVSADVDLLVSPGSQGKVREVLEKFGWSERPASAVARALISHSWTFSHPRWDVDIDLHWRFPGMLIDDNSAFNNLHARQVELEFAGRSIPCANRPSSILIGALHALRSPGQSPRHEREFLYLRDDVVPSLSAAEQEQLVALARDLGALDTVRPVLQGSPIELPSPTPWGVDPALDRWRERVATSVPRHTVLRHAFAEMSPMERILFLVRAVVGNGTHRASDRAPAAFAGAEAPRSFARRTVAGLSGIAGIFRARRWARQHWRNLMPPGWSGQ
ncbi:nucleotidyltransferase family protein [Demequina lignilytica]|uniref:nucleotidyltransferase family protein n=1 Tax=Demequina lignilytica TaxID=3051663 RepID=UPI00345F0EE2